MSATPLSAAAIAQLEAKGVDTVIGSAVNPAGLTQAKTVPIRRTSTFRPRLGRQPFVARLRHRPDRHRLY